LSTGSNATTPEALTSFLCSTSTKTDSTIGQQVGVILFFSKKRFHSLESSNSKKKNEIRHMHVCYVKKKVLIKGFPNRFYDSTLSEHTVLHQLGKSRHFE